MKVNPIGIQSYQQINRNDRQPQIEKETPFQLPGDKVTIQPQDEVSQSKVAVKAKVESYDAMLSPQEKQALDLLFSRFKESGRFGYSGTEETDSKSLGNFVDVKV